jgi:hypothetical protein
MNDLMKKMPTTFSLTLVSSVLIALFSFSLSTTPAHAISIDVHIPEKYTEVEAGERLYFEINVKYPENPRRKDLRLQYEIIKDDEVIAQAKVLKAIETQASFIDFIVMPESVEKGLHLIVVSIRDYKDLDEEVSTSFNVTKSRTEEITTYFFILLGIILITTFLVIINIFLTNIIRKRK